MSAAGLSQSDGTGRKAEIVKRLRLAGQATIDMSTPPSANLLSTLAHRAQFIEQAATWMDGSNWI
jgi:hypothetical protein